MAGGIQVPVASIQQPTANRAPAQNTYTPQERIGGAIQGRFDSGPAYLADTAAAERKMASGRGLAAFGAGLGEVSRALEEQARYRQSIEAMEKMNAFQDEERAAFDEMEKLKGQAGLDEAESFMANFYSTAGNKLLESSRGQYQQLAYERFLGQTREAGLNKANAYAGQEGRAWTESVAQGRYALLDRDIDNDPDNFQWYSQEKTRAWMVANPGMDPTAARMGFEDEDAQRAFDSYANREDLDGARRIARQYDGSDGFSPQIAAAIDAAAERSGVDPALLRAVAITESGGDPRAVSRAGAQGLFQLMPGTARDMGVSDPFDPDQSAQGGARYLGELLQKYNGNEEYALAAYNWGPENFDRYLQRGGRGGLPRETRNYIAKVMGNRERNSGGGGFSMPVDPSSRVSSPFGLREKPAPGATSDHKGVDWAVPVGTEIASIGAGRVLFVGRNKGYGLQVQIDHGNGVVSWYSHLSSVQGLREGQAVGQGSLLALSGGAKGDPNAGVSTGPHLDFKVYVDGQAVDPVDFLRNNGAMARRGNSAVVGQMNRRLSQMQSDRDAGFKALATQVKDNWDAHLSGVAENGVGLAGIEQALATSVAAGTMKPNEALNLEYKATVARDVYSLINSPEAQGTSFDDAERAFRERYALADLAPGEATTPERAAHLAAFEDGLRQIEEAREKFEKQPMDFVAGQADSAYAAMEKAGEVPAGREALAKIEIRRQLAMQKGVDPSRAMAMPVLTSEEDAVITKAWQEADLDGKKRMLDEIDQTYGKYASLVLAQSEIGPGAQVARGITGADRTSKMVREIALQTDGLALSDIKKGMDTEDVKTVETRVVNAFNDEDTVLGLLTARFNYSADAEAAGQRAAMQESFTKIALELVKRGGSASDAVKQAANTINSGYSVINDKDLAMVAVPNTVDAGALEEGMRAITRQMGATWDSLQGLFIDAGDDQGVVIDTVDGTAQYFTYDQLAAVGGASVGAAPVEIDYRTIAQAGADARARELLAVLAPKVTPGGVQLAGNGGE